MPIRTVERRGREYGPKRGLMKFAVNGTLDEAEAISAVVGGGTPLAPQTWGDLTRGDYVAREVRYKTWEIDVDFGSPSLEPLEGVTHWSYNTDGASVLQKFLQHDMTGDTYAKPGETAPALGRAIGVNADGTIEGVERVVPNMAAEARTRFPSSMVDAAYIGSVFNLTGTICDDDGFHMFGEGEALFMGARLTQVNASWWDATFLFLGSPSLTDLKIGSISGISKQGWQYLWVYAVAKAYDAGDTPVLGTEAKYVYVDNIYKKTDFSLLGIPS